MEQKPVTVLDGEMKKKVDGAAAQLIRFAVEHAEFLNSTNAAGVIQFHCGGREQNLKVKYDLNLPTTP